jgi:hypothetical protein
LLRVVVAALLSSLWGILVIIIMQRLWCVGSSLMKGGVTLGVYTQEFLGHLLL